MTPSKRQSILLAAVTLVTIDAYVSTTPNHRNANSAISSMPRFKANNPGPISMKLQMQAFSNSRRSFSSDGGFLTRGRHTSTCTTQLNTVPHVRTLARTDTHTDLFTHPPTHTTHTPHTHTHARPVAPLGFPILFQCRHHPSHHTTASAVEQHDATEHRRAGNPKFCA